jgi:hypothetical protein
LEVGDDFEPATVEGVQPRESRVVAWRSVGVIARFPSQVLVDADQDDDELDVAGVERAALDPWQRE